MELKVDCSWQKQRWEKNKKWG